MVVVLAGGSCELKSNNRKLPGSFRAGLVVLDSSARSSTFWRAAPLIWLLTRPQRGHASMHLQEFMCKWSTLWTCTRQDCATRTARLVGAYTCQFRLAWAIRWLPGCSIILSIKVSKCAILLMLSESLKPTRSSWYLDHIV